MRSQKLSPSDNNERKKISRLVFWKMPLATCRIQGVSISASRMLAGRALLGVIWGRTVVLQCEAHIGLKRQCWSLLSEYTGNDLSSILRSFLEGSLKKKGNVSEIY